MVRMYEFHRRGGIVRKRGAHADRSEPARSIHDVKRLILRALLAMMLKERSDVGSRENLTLLVTDELLHAIARAVIEVVSKQRERARIARRHLHKKSAQTVAVAPFKFARGALFAQVTARVVVHRNRDAAAPDAREPVAIRIQLHSAAETDTAGAVSKCKQIPGVIVGCAPDSITGRTNPDLGRAGFLDPVRKHAADRPNGSGTWRSRPSDHEHRWIDRNGYSGWAQPRRGACHLSDP